MSSLQIWTFVMVGITFALYIGIAIWSRAKSTKDFYVAGGGVSPLVNGLATAADWMSAASFISMAGLISFMGYDGGVYLMGWTGGYVLLALLLAPYLRKFGQFTVPDFVGARYAETNANSQINWARLVAVICALFVSFTYVVGQMKGVGVAFSRFLNVEFNTGIFIGIVIVFFYAVLGGMKGITYTQVAQYCVLIFAYMVPAIFISIQLTNNPVPQMGFLGDFKNEGISLIEKLNQLNTELGFVEYTSGTKSTIDIFFITAALMLGTAGLPHVIVRFFTVPKVSDARKSAGYALLFIAILYTTAPAVAAFARTNLIETVSNKEYSSMPTWFSNWENSGLLAWSDKNDDGKIQYLPGPAFADDKGTVPKYATGEERGKYGERRTTNPSDGDNELYVNNDIMVLANPEIADLPDWVIALVVAGGLAAALSTAAGLLLVISTSISHDLLKKTFMPNISDRQELLFARISIGVAVILAGIAGTLQLGFVAQVVAFAFGLAASSFFPAILLGIFDKRTNRLGAISGMVIGILFTATYIIYFKIANPELNNADNWWFGISPEGIGTLGMIFNMIATLVVSRLTSPPSEEIQQMIEDIRIPRGAGDATH